MADLHLSRIDPSPDSYFSSPINNGGNNRIEITGRDIKTSQLPAVLIIGFLIAAQKQWFFPTIQTSWSTK